MALFRTISTIEEYQWVNEAIEHYADAEMGTIEARLLKIYVWAVIKYQKQNPHVDSITVVNANHPNSSEAFEETAA